jgi:hypothetical protein
MKDEKNRIKKNSKSIFFDKCKNIKKDEPLLDTSTPTWSFFQISTFSILMVVPVHLTALLVIE